VNGGTPQIAPVQVLNGQPVTRPADPTKEGYTFNTWILDGTNLGWGFTNPVREDITLNADWVENSALPNIYTVTFDANGGSPTPADQTLEENQSVVIPTEPTREGYVFVAWCVGTENGEAYDFNIPVSSNLHLVAKWGLAEEYSIQLSKHTMTFDDYGQEMLSVIQNENKPENVSWSSSDSNLAMFIANPDGNGKVGRVVCSATAGTNTTVTITCTGVTSGLSDTCVVTINIPAETPQEPEVHVYTLSISPDQPQTITSGENGITFVATPMDNGSAITEPQTIAWTSSNSSAATVDGGTVTPVSGLTTSASTTITATWASPDGIKTATCSVTVIPITHTVTFRYYDSNDEPQTWGSPVTVNHGEPVAEPATHPEKASNFWDWEFTGWADIDHYDWAQEKVLWDFSTPITNDTVIYARFDVIGQHEESPTHEDFYEMTLNPTTMNLTVG